MATVAAVLVCLILLSVGVNSDPGGSPCGSVLASEKQWDGEVRNSCSGPLNGRLTLSLVVGAVGVAAFFGSTQINKREDD
jgi:hypothetical protein